jgi:NADPH:quinone reductase-like Zn-dependent oxidoreductase
LIAIIESGDIVPVVATTYPLERITDAQRAFQTKSYVGKFVIGQHLQRDLHGR